MFFFRSSGGLHWRLVITASHNLGTTPARIAPEIGGLERTLCPDQGSRKLEDTKTLPYSTGGELKIHAKGPTTGEACRTRRSKLTR